ncbi:hypothetical protein AB1Y20_011348 [Prymnesium parvum]|uniref:Uncharacterized protein n=1 Tax=Prymnesium parvum TaxID=97485 RepID=A0AB34ILK9_PRYPA
MPPKSFLRLELVDGSLSVAAIQAEVAKRSQRSGWSAFAPKYSSFALRSFSDAMAAEEVDGFEAISHASSQVCVRTSLVQAMTSEVRREVEAALHEARAAPSRPAVAAGRSADPPEGGADQAAAAAVRQAWEPALARCERLVEGAADGRIDLQLHRFAAWPKHASRRGKTNPALRTLCLAPLLPGKGGKSQQAPSPVSEDMTVPHATRGRGARRAVVLDSDEDDAREGEAQEACEAEGGEAAAGYSQGPAVGCVEMAPPPSFDDDCLPDEVLASAMLPETIDLEEVDLASPLHGQSLEELAEGQALLVPLDATRLRYHAPPPRKRFKLCTDPEATLLPLPHLAPSPLPSHGLVDRGGKLEFLLPKRCTDLRLGAKMFENLLSVDASADEWRARGAEKRWAPQSPAANGMEQRADAPLDEPQEGGEEMMVDPPLDEMHERGEGGGGAQSHGAEAVGSGTPRGGEAAPLPSAARAAALPPPGRRATLRQLGEWVARRAAGGARLSAVVRDAQSHDEPPTHSKQRLAERPAFLSAWDEGCGFCRWMEATH